MKHRSDIQIERLENTVHDSRKNIMVLKIRSCDRQIFGKYLDV